MDLLRDFFYWIHPVGNHGRKKQATARRSADGKDCAAGISLFPDFMGMQQQIPNHLYSTADYYGLGRIFQVQGRTAYLFRILKMRYRHSHPLRMAITHLQVRVITVKNESNPPHSSPRFYPSNPDLESTGEFLPGIPSTRSKGCLWQREPCLPHAFPKSA